MTTYRPGTAMILAAGLGTRLRPLTDTMPKALVPYNGAPMIESLILRLKAAGFSRLVINVHHFADMLEDFVRSRDCFGPTNGTCCATPEAASGTPGCQVCWETDRC